MKIKINSTLVGSNSQFQAVGTDKTDIPHTHIYDCSLSWLVTGSLVD
jgi:hypothetical protein